MNGVGNVDLRTCESAIHVRKTKTRRVTDLSQGVQDIIQPCGTVLSWTPPIYVVPAQIQPILEGKNGQNARVAMIRLNSEQNAKQGLGLVQPSLDGINVPLRGSALARGSKECTSCRWKIRNRDRRMTRVRRLIIACIKLMRSSGYV